MDHFASYLAETDKLEVVDNVVRLRRAKDDEAGGAQEEDEQ